MPAHWKFVNLGSLLACSVLAACSGVLESGKPAKQVYMLQPPPASSTSESAHIPQTLIMSVKAVPGLDTDKILVLGNDARLNPVSNARWSDNLPEVFTSITRRYLSGTNHFGAVKEGQLSRPDEWQLELELQAFYGTQSSGGNTDGVELMMEGLLHCGGEQYVLRISQQGSASGDSLSALVAAHQRVLNKALKQLPDQINENCQNPS
jgi:ABC-type uncharacterized transport system auxiliary subunit